MSLEDYLKDSWAVLGIRGLAWLAAASFLVLMGVELPVAAVAWAVLAVGGAASFFYDFFRRKQYYDELQEIMEGLHEKSYLSEMLEEPDFYDGRLLFEIVKINGKYLNDAVSARQRELLEYKEYVETWAHEVKTPIAVERLILENNKNGMAESLLEEVGKIESYVEQMLYYTKSGNLEADYRLRPVTLKKLCMDAVQKNSRLMVGNHVFPRLGQLGSEVLADSKWMEFILGQLIANSVKYRDRERDCWISFDACPEEPGQDGQAGRVRLEVSDNGIGIPSQDLPKVFAKGFTGENGRVYKKSTGIGLYLCKNLCDKMGISMTIRSVPDQGTTVSMRFVHSGENSSALSEAAK